MDTAWLGMVSSISPRFLPIERSLGAPFNPALTGNHRLEFKVPSRTTEETCTGCVGPRIGGPPPCRRAGEPMNTPKGKSPMSQARFLRFVKGRYWMTLTKAAEHPYKVFQDR